MTRLWLFLCVVLIVHITRACDENSDEQLAAARQQESVDYVTNAYGFSPNAWDSPYYYQQPSRIPEYVNPYEARTPINRQQPANLFRNYADKNLIDENNQAEGRFGISNLGASILNAGLFNNRFPSGSTLRPFAGLTNRLPISLNPNFVSPVSSFDSCTSANGESGICSPGSVCSLFGGRPSGSCLLGGVCCINAITTCGGTLTLNNTYWQSPTTAVSSPSTCALTVKLDTKFVEQRKPICQVRLDFISFTIGTPTTGTCADTFQVGGATNKVPIICGENNGQHMYLEIPSSATKPTDLQLMFNFASGVTATRSWNIKIAMIPCGASYIAPSNCLQYFTSTSGKVKSFNWNDAATARQLNNQDYNICFRTEVVDNQQATQMCVSVCTTKTANVGFFITGALAGNSLVGTGDRDNAACSNDYILFAGGNALVTIGADTTLFTADRYCGGRLSPAPAPDGADTSVASLCSPMKPFRISFKTDSTEPATAVDPVDGETTAGVGADVDNTGFCLDFTEK